MKNNEVFNEIRRTATEWETAKRERSERKKSIIKEFGYDSPEYAAWSESDTETPFPISHGAMKAYHAWRSNNENDTEEFEFNDFTWETETKDFIDTLRKAGIETMIITNASTALHARRTLHSQEKNDLGNGRRNSGDQAQNKLSRPAENGAPPLGSAFLLPFS